MKQIEKEDLDAASFRMFITLIDNIIGVFPAQLLGQVMHSALTSLFRLFCYLPLSLNYILALFLQY
jgi:hypothetical protein